MNNKRIIVRLDLNVPISKNKIEDETRLEVVEPFLNRLIENKAKLILLSTLEDQKAR